MSCLNRFLVLFFVFLALSSLLVLSFPSTAVAKLTTTKPSVPQFSVKIVGDYYYTPPSTTISVDQFTGKETTIATPGYYRDEREVVVSIKNQPFTPYTATDGKKYELYYIVKYKGHFGGEWRNFWMPTFQSNSEYTTIYGGPKHVSTTAGDQLDFMVEARIGYSWDGSPYSEGADDCEVSYVYHADNRIIFHTYLDVTCSGWSSVVTFTVPEPGEITTVLPTDTSNPAGSDDFHSSPPQSPLWATNLLMIIATVCLITIPIAITTYCYGQRKTRSDKHKPRQDQNTT
jgi:hypothetical protein